MAYPFIVARVPGCAAMHNPHLRCGDLLLTRGKTLTSEEASYKFVVVVRRIGNLTPLQRLKPASTKLRFGRAEARPSWEMRTFCSRREIFEDW